MYISNPRSQSKKRSSHHQNILISNSTVETVNLSLRRKAQLRPARIKNNILTLQENIPKNRKLQALVTLDATKARLAALSHRRPVDVLARDNSDVVTDRQREGGQLGVAGEYDAAGLLVVFGGGDFVVVGLDDFVVEHHECCTGVYATISLAIYYLEAVICGEHTSNSGESAGGGVAASVTDAIAAGGELPESVAAVDISVSNRSLVLLLIDEAEIIGSWGVVLQGNSKKGSVELRLDSVEEGFLGLGLNYT